MVFGRITNLLDMVSNSIEGVAWAIPEEWANKIILDNKLELKQRHYNMTGEKSAIFELNGKTIRLERMWTGRYKLYHGDWKSDPR